VTVPQQGHSSERLAFADLAEWAGIKDAQRGFATYKELNSLLWRQVEAGTIKANDVRVLRSVQLIDALDLNVDPAEMSDRFLASLGARGELYEGAEAVLDELATFGRIGMVTNGIGVVQRAKIERLNLDRWFDAYAISGELGTAKPDPTIVHHLLDDLGWHTESSTPVLIGDSLRSDISAASAAGISSCWFNPHGAELGEATPTPTWQVGSLAELPNVIRAAFA